MPDTKSESIVDLEINQHESASMDATIAILAEVLCVFAARGRAIREGRAKLPSAEMANRAVPSVLGEEQHEPSENAMDTEPLERGLDLTDC